MSIRTAIARFRELHDDYKAGAFKSPDALKFYESERDEFMAALLQAQQLTLRAGQSPRQTLRVNREEPLVVAFGPRREEGRTLDIGLGGFAAAPLGPFAAHITCDFELGSTDAPIKGKARVVTSTKLPTGIYRTSFQLTTIAPEERKRLEIIVVDTALATIPRT